MPAARYSLPWWSRPLLVVLVVAAYAGTLRADFLRWDDLDHIYQNPRVTAPNGLVRSWTETASPGFYPVTYTTFHLEWQAAGGAPWLFHLDNVLLHAGNALLVASLGGQLGLAPAASWFVAALWALHPMQVASVAWATERKNVLYVLLYLSALSLFLAAGKKPRAVYVLSVALFGLALLSKAAAMTLPAALVLATWARGRQLDRRLWLSIVPYAVLALGAGLALLGSVPEGLQVPGLATRLTLPPRILAFYAAKFLWPHRLLPMYARWPLDPPGLGSYLPWLGLAAVAAAAFLLRRRLPRLALFGLGFFLVNVALVAGVTWFTYFDHSPVADHLAYLPLLGLAFAAVAVVFELARAAEVPGRIAAAGLAVWCAALGIATWRQVPVWHDTERLWTYTLAHNPECATCHYNLGILLEDRGEIEAAAEHYERSLRARPDSEPAINLGNVRMVQNRFAEARDLYQRAVELEPRNEKAHYNLGLALARLGRTDEAIARYRHAIRLAPRFADAHRYLGESLLEKGSTREAADEFEDALRLVPGDAAAERGLARSAAASEDWAKAIAHYERALASKDGTGAARTHRELAEALQQVDREDEAIVHYQAAARLDPDDADAGTDLAAALLGRERVAEAVAVLEERVARAPKEPSQASALAWIKATARDPRWRDAGEAVRLAEHACSSTKYADPDQLDTLAAAYAEAGRFPEATRTARRALEANPTPDHAEEIRARLTLYETNRPYRSPW